jgi:hypothetical protein
MKKVCLLIVIVTITSAINSGYSQDAKDLGLTAITKSAVKGQLEFLASDWTEGRSTGQPGAYMAADYIASLFKVYGLEPAGDMTSSYVRRAERLQGKRPESDRTFYQSFNLIEYKSGEDQQFSLVNNSGVGTRSVNFAYQTDFSVRTSDVAIELEMPVVFVGYGYTNEKAGYDDFKGIDVKGKIILCLSGYPGQEDESSKAYEKIGSKSRWALYREKSKIASDLGVAAIIEVNPGSDVMESWADNLPFRYNSGNYEGDIPRASYYDSRMKHPGDKISGDPTRITVSDRVLNVLLEGTDIDLEKFAEDVKNSLKPDSKPLPGKTLKIKTSVDSKIIRARNVVGVLPGKDTTEVIVIGGHYRPSSSPRGGSDHTSFAEKDVPVFYFMAGFPPEYHQPGDHLNLINWDKMVNIIKVGYLNIWDLANTEWSAEE